MSRLSGTLGGDGRVSQEGGHLITASLMDDGVD